jgi:hypothetical protein
MKIDIEDSEWKALMSASYLFEMVDITHCLFEWSEKWKRPQEALFILNFFLSRGYLPHFPTEDLHLLGTSYKDSITWPFDVLWIKSNVKN